DTARLAHEAGIKNVMVSNGYETDRALEMLAPFIDAMNIDLKAFTQAFYSRLCKADLNKVLATIRKAHSLGIWLEITTLIIPGQNDSDEEMTSIARFIASLSEDIPWHLSAFHPDHKMKDAAATPLATLRRAWDIGKNAGLRYIYIGNVRDDEHQRTQCPSCGKSVIERRGYDTTMKGFKDGRCACGQAIPGVWS
ncbi:MAG: radical SAM protein, partial [Nanoarchaeota archaeon]